MSGSIMGRKSYDARSVRDSLKLVAWTFIWMASLTVSDKAALYGWWDSAWITMVSIATNVLLGLGLIIAFMRMLSRMDELQRKIQLDALSLALGISLVGCAAYSLLVTWGYIQDEEVTDIFVLMCVSYSAGAIFGVLKYR
jgi:hypothetical protein